MQGYNPNWPQQIMDKFNGRCHYTGAAIEIGGEETASVVLDIPRKLAPIYGEAKVIHPDNLVWCHRAVKRFKGQLTGADFKTLWGDLALARQNIAK